jgi:hypothetical protein
MFHLVSVLPSAIEIWTIEASVIAGIVLAIVLGLYGIAKKWPSRAMEAWKKRGRYWEHVEAHVTGFEIIPKTNVSGDARLEVRVCNFTKRPVSASLLIEDWSVAGCDMPRANIASSTVTVPAGKSDVLVVHGSPSSDDLTRLEGPVPLMSRIRDGYPVTLSASFEGWLILVVGKKTSRRQFSSTFDYGKVRLLQPPDQPRPPRHVGPIPL